MDDLVKKDLSKQGYRIVGNHSAVKVCLWCKKAIKDEDICYKQTFYGIKSHQCIQSSVSLTNCTHKCTFCWRSLEHTDTQEIKNPDSPKDIVDGLIKEQELFLRGFKGNVKSDEEKYKESKTPKHIALSLAGDATLYPLLPELIQEIHSRDMTSFLVTNGQQPEMLKKLISIAPTQTYVTLPAPNEEIYKKTCNPHHKDGWDRLMKSLETLQQFPRSTIRLSVMKGLNLTNPEQYAEIIKKFPPMFVEIKAVMSVGYAQYRMSYEQMATHEEIIEFSQKIANFLGYKIVAEKKESRVCLIMKEDEDRLIFFPKDIQNKLYQQELKDKEEWEAIQKAKQHPK
jgi:tRNA wybutosine-synthesizing protein 1